MFRRVSVLVLFLAITACSDSDRSSRDDIDPVDNTPPAVGVRLTGTGTSPALQSFQRVGPASVNPADVRDGFVLSRLEVAIDPAATVDQVNAALRVVGGGIVTMRPGFPVMVVAVPPQVDDVALTALANQLAGAPGIRFALPARTEALVRAPPAPANGPTSFEYLQDGRFPAAWNARRAARSCLDPVALLVADAFHRPADALYNDFASQVPGVQDIGGDGPPREPPPSGGPDNGYFVGFHGYDVFMTAVAELDGTLPTGAFPYPDCFEKSAMQIHDLSGRFDVAFRLVDSLPASGKVVVNASFGYGDCEIPCTAATLRPVKAVDRALYGVVLRALLEPHVDRLLLVSAAGNAADDVSACYYPGLGRAEYASMFNVAATSDAEMSWVSDPELWTPRPDAICDPTVPSGSLVSIAATPSDRAILEAFIRDMGQTGAPPLPNVLIVGSSNGLSPSEFSNEGSFIDAVGENILSLLGGVESGTSLAAPQIAALAGSLWLMSSELRERPAAETIATILANHSSFPANLVDAYLAVLSLESGLALSRENSTIRLALLDADENDVFNSDDLRTFHAAYFDSGIELEPSDRDDSRFDLNGDGYTGGSRVKSFDLDPQSSTRFGARNLTEVSTEIRGALRTYNELTVTDLDILCFYAWSPLYSAIESEQAARDELLGDICVEPPTGPVVFAGQVTQVHASELGRFPTPDPNRYGTRTETLVADISLAVDEDENVTAFEISGTYDAVTQFTDLSPGACSYEVVTTGSVVNGFPPTSLALGPDIVGLTYDATYTLTYSCGGAETGSFNEAANLSYRVIRSQDGQSILALDFNGTEVEEPQGTGQIEARTTITTTGRLEAMIQ